MSDPTNPLQEARARFADEGMPFPPVPTVFEAEFRCIAPWTYGTRPTLPASLYDIHTFVEEAAESPVDDYLLMGHDGHGINSYAMHYYLVYGPLALFVQIGWGGAYMDKAQSVNGMNQLFAELDSILPLVNTSRKTDEPLTQSDERLIVMLSQFYGLRWRLPKEETWREEGDVFQAVKDFLK